MPMTDLNVIEALRRADPVQYLRDEASIPTSPPQDVLERIVTSPPARLRPRRVLVPALAAVAVVVGVAIVLSSSGGPSLAARAYAATSPGEWVYYTETTTESRIVPVGGAQGGSWTLADTWTWQWRDRMHDTMEVVDIAPGKRRRLLYEHDQNGPVFRTLFDGDAQTIRKDDPGWRGSDGPDGFRQNTTNVVDSYREQFAKRALRDAGETTFAGRRAHAYEVVGEPPGQTETFYIDADTALPLGHVLMGNVYAPAVDSDGRPVKPSPTDTPSGKLTLTEIVKRFERLTPTPANLAKLDAPAIDAAARSAGTGSTRTTRPR
jgi:hypothetical protein